MSERTRLHRIDTFDDQQATRGVVEATAGTRSKLKYNAALDIFEQHHVLPVGMAFPWDFGFIPSTLGGDGDPLDVLQATQSRQGRPPTHNDRFLAVARHGSRFAHWCNLADVPEAVLAQLEHFFVSYNEQRGVVFRPAGRADAASAMQLLEQGRSRFGSGS